MEISQEFFHNKRSYDAFMWAAGKCKELQILQEQGALIFDENELVVGKFIVRCEGTDSLVGVEDGYCTTGLVGWCWDEASGKIYCTMQWVKKRFGKFKYVDLKDIKKVC